MNTVYLECEQRRVAIYAPVRELIMAFNTYILMLERGLRVFTIKPLSRPWCHSAHPRSQNLPQALLVLGCLSAMGAAHQLDSVLTIPTHSGFSWFTHQQHAPSSSLGRKIIWSSEYQEVGVSPPAQYFHFLITVFQVFLLHLIS